VKSSAESSVLWGTLNLIPCAEQLQANAASPNNRLRIGGFDEK